MGKFFKILVLLLAIVVMLLVFVAPDAIKHDGVLYFIQGKVEQVVAADEFYIGGEHIKLWGVSVPSSQSQPEPELETKIPEIFSTDAAADDSVTEKPEQSPEEILLVTLSARLKKQKLRCFRRGMNENGATEMTCFTEKMSDYATCLLGQGIVEPAAYLQNHKYQAIYQASKRGHDDTGKNAAWGGCH